MYLNKRCIYWSIWPLLLLLTSCGDGSVNEQVARYGLTLPNFCTNDEILLSTLEDEPKLYGQLLAQKGFLGEWNGLLHGLSVHYFIWGDYNSAVRTGLAYMDATGNSGFLEYQISKYISDFRPNVSQSDSLEKAEYPDEIFSWGTSEIQQSRGLGFSSVRNVSDFEKWADGDQGFKTMLILSARLHDGRSSRDEVDAIMDCLLPFFSTGDTLKKFSSLAGGYAPWVWEIWLKSGLFIEEYGQKEQNAVIVKLIQGGRMYVAAELSGTSAEPGWVDCVINNKGVFSR